MGPLHSSLGDRARLSLENWLSTYCRDGENGSFLIVQPESAKKRTRTKTVFVMLSIDILSYSLIAWIKNWINL